MRALCWHGTNDIRYDTVPDPELASQNDVIIKVTACAICGSDLHIMDGFVPSMQSGDILGHETMGEVVEVGREVRNLKVGDRVVVPFNISCGECWFCQNELYSLCERSNAEGAALQRPIMGQPTAALFGYSHMFGGIPGGQAEYLRVPYADVGPIKVPHGISDAQALFLSDIFPTGWMAAENADITPGDTVAIWGAGPVGQFTLRSAQIMGAARVIVIDEVPERLAMAEAAGAETIDFSKEDVYERLMEMTEHRGPHACIDAVGTEAAGHGAVDAVVDAVKKTVMLGTDRAHVLREVIRCVRPGGTLSIPGVYVGFVDKFMMGPFMNKGLTMKTGQTHCQKYLPKLLGLIEDGTIDPSFIVTHERPLSDGPDLYKTFRDKHDGCIKVMLRP